MGYPIDRKLVVGVSTNALFNLEYEDKIFKEEGVSAYRKYQEQNIEKLIHKGVAFPFIRRFLNINNHYPKEKPIEVVLLSKNSSETGLRIFKSIKHYGLDITRAAFTSGSSPYKYIPAYNVSLFLSTDDNDVLNAIQAGFAAGRFLKSNVEDKDDDKELRVAFDFDGVLADDESEKVFAESQNLDTYFNYESAKSDVPLNPGPLSDFFKKLSYFQKLETKKLERDKSYKSILKTAIVTARNAPAHERIVATLKNWGVTVDELFLLGGIDKSRVLEIFKPQIYFDDQTSHLNTKIKNIPLVHIPFGIRNSNKINPS
ncbi:MAG: 5'-nucleotidase [Ignavibacteriales bacterium]|nr:5'-nucleotidase [Ignavibacteriales bacterium]